MTRPKHLPEFDDPPLNEVALGIQFAPVTGYQCIHSSEVWDLFRKEFPKVQEFSSVLSEFETFGGTNVKPNFQLQIGPPHPVGSRLWFISDDDSHLLQFQPDCLITNWRKTNVNESYPRFEGIAEFFETNLRTLSDFFTSNFDYQIDINQAEVTYVNIIPVDDFSEVSKWFSILGGDDFKIESLLTDFKEVITDRSDRPFARLKHEIATVSIQDGKKKAIRLSLTFRGKPIENDIESAMSFISLGRDRIVSRFDQITTAKAHRIWGKQ